MKIAYVDTSYLVAIVFAEPGSENLSKQLQDFDRLVAANLLEAELRSTLLREGVLDDPQELFSNLSWILPNRPLTLEFKRVLSFGYVKGADLWHLGSALFLGVDPAQITFLSLDKRQQEIAAALGFKSRPPD